ncbi:hypothetical protein RvY_14098 [Ramazzottius varieornatus]|uniref:Uncharacterized protein n=1 Tax=Ramazzottius varieornatus TaxID=947166 RepID=A0A1D1VYM7_RAMVA|nr:hypothetical protein RvY_14098 [Ramazzottius varieornatus]
MDNFLFLAVSSFHLPTSLRVKGYPVLRLVTIKNFEIRRPVEKEKEKEKEKGRNR